MSDEPARPAIQRARVYLGSGIVDETFDAKVAELLTTSNAAAQISVLPEGDGFLIRAWGPNELHEFGGGNGNLLSLVLRIVDGKLVVGSINVYERRA